MGAGAGPRAPKEGGGGARVCTALCSVESSSRSHRKSWSNRRCSEKVMIHSNVHLLKLKPKRGRGFFFLSRWKRPNNLPLISH